MTFFNSLTRNVFNHYMRRFFFDLVYVYLDIYMYKFLILRYMSIKNVIYHILNVGNKAKLQRAGPEG